MIKMAKHTKEQRRKWKEYYYQNREEISKKRKIKYKKLHPLDKTKRFCIECKKRLKGHQKKYCSKKCKYKYLGRKNAKRYNKRYKDYRRVWHKENRERLKGIKDQANEKYFKRKKDEENERRKKLGLPLINKGYKRELEIKKVLNKLFKNELYYDNKFWKLKNQKIIKGSAKEKDFQLDRYYPLLNLAFEHNGEQHYKWCKYFHPDKREFLKLLSNDKKKKEVCEKVKIKLVVIKYNESITQKGMKEKIKNA